MPVQVGAGVLCERLGVDLSDRSFLKRRVGKPASRARGGIHTWFGRFVLACFFSPHLRRLREFVWVGGCVTVPVAWAQVRAPWHHGGHGAVYVVGPVTPPGRASPVLSPVARVRAPAGSACPQGQECTQIGENGLLELFWGIRVHCCDARIVRAAMRVATRTVSDGTSASTAMARRRRPLGGRLPLGRENRLYASAAASLPSSPRQQPIQIPEEPFVFSLEVEALMPPRVACPPCAARSCARPRGPSRVRAAVRRAR